MKYISIFAFFLILFFTSDAFSAVKTWDGGGADANWATAVNWVGDVAPVVNDDLVFPATAAKQTNNNNIGLLTTFRSLTIEGGGYTIGGNAIRLTNGLTVADGTHSINTIVNLGAAQTFTFGDNSFTAAEKKKSIIGLETAQSQFDALNKTPVQEQAKKLYEMALDPNKSFADFKKLVEIYKMQDSDALYNEMSAQMSKDKTFQTTLLDNRNVAWIPKLEKEMNEKSSFIAVGGGHLGGKKGVINLLKAKGYKITAIKI
jgi:hypothetical protein